MKFIYHSVFKREQTAETLKAAGAGLDTAYAVLERQLASAPYLAGTMFSLAEVCFAPYLEYLALTPAAGKLADYPRVAAWWAAISERPAWRKAAGR